MDIHQQQSIMSPLCGTFYTKGITHDDTLASLNAQLTGTDGYQL
jgi:hypothetical protein